MKLLKIDKITLVLILLIIPIGFYSKFYNGYLNNWVNNSLSGSFYVVFWCFSGFLFYKKPLQITIIVFVITSMLEFMQLWHTLFLEHIRGYFIGRTLIGNSFNWTDYIYYAIGCLIAFFIMKILEKKYLE